MGDKKTCDDHCVFSVFRFVCRWDCWILLLAAVLVLSQVREELKTISHVLSTATLRPPVYTHLSLWRLNGRRSVLGRGGEEIGTVACSFVYIDLWGLLAGLQKWQWLKGSVVQFCFWRQKISGTSFDKRIEDVLTYLNLRKASEPRQKPAIVSIVDSADQRFSFFWTGPATNQQQSSSNTSKLASPKTNIYHPSPSWMLMHHTGWWFQTFGLFSMSYMG